MVLVILASVSAAMHLWIVVEKRWLHEAAIDTIPAC